MILGAAMTLPMILISGPIAGYVIGRYILVKFFGLNSNWVIALVGLGLIASALQSYRLILKIKELDSKSKS